MLPGCPSCGRKYADYFATKERSRILITFSGKAYDNTTKEIVERSPGFGVDEVRVYDDRWLIEQEFYQLNKQWWSTPDTKYNIPEGRGFGWFIWKPFILLHALERMGSGDCVLFVDADTYPISDLGVVYERCNAEQIVLFKAQGCRHENYCKRDTFIVMGQDDPIWRYRQHAVARFMLFQKGPWKVQQFLMEWLTYCLNPLANTFDESRIIVNAYSDLEHQELKEPRCEQAILTNLAHKYGIPLYREACQAGEASEGYEDTWFPRLFHQDGNCGDKNDLSGSAYRNVS